MKKKDAINSLLAAQHEIECDPELEECDTLALMEEAISDALEYLTGNRPEPLTDCAHCDRHIKKGHGQSTFCGSMHRDCIEDHGENCEVCRKEFC
jgi:hypothetical protein